ncbi:MAG TPA: hypothetical protein VKT82_05485 [Ktedonobacterales bacterium]|nr:hypothetical protein [Ktedonobacterales bacterium]
MRKGFGWLKQAFIDDWQGTRRLSYGLIVLCLTSLAVVLFYLNHPQPDVNNDTVEYLAVTHKILTTGNPIDDLRTPGYPSFVALVYLLAGQGNLTAVGIAQGILFILATLEIYTLTLLVLRRSWVALCVGVLMGTSTYLLGFVKPIIVEGLTLWLTVSLALVVVLCIRTMKPAYFWLSAAILLVLFMTRPEWVYLPVPLFGYLLLLAHRRGLLRKMMPQSLAAVALLYLALGLFVVANATENGYVGITSVQNLNLVGKILEYRMQAEAPAQYAAIVQVADPFVQQGGWDPNQLAPLYPSLANPHWQLGGAYAQSIILHHPVQFILDTIPLLFTSSRGYSSASPIQAQGAFAGPLAALDAISADVYRSYELFLLFVVFWAALLCWRRTTHLPVVEMMGAVVLLAFYELLATSVGGYVQFWRLHIPFDPLMTVIIWGSVLASVPLWKPALDRLAVPWGRLWWAWVAVLVAAAAGGLALAVYKRGVTGTLALAGKALADHPLAAALALLLIGAFTVYAYRRKASGSLAGALEEEKETAKAISLH